MTVKMETCMKTDWLYSRVMTYRLLSEMLQRRPTLSKLIEWRKEAGRIRILSGQSNPLIHMLENIPLTNIIQYAYDECVQYDQLFLEQRLPHRPRAAEYLPGAQERWSYEATLNSIYARAGIAFKKMDQETDDHVGIELEFMSLLAERMAESEGNVLEQNAMIQAQTDFLENYLLPWVPSFCRELNKAAEHNLYQMWAKTASAYLIEDLYNLRVYAAEQHLFR
ncbi:TorD/DmsD family molecular chaperone [Paenibacillus sp. Z6-24]